MYYLDNKRHHVAHLHVENMGEQAVLAIESAQVLEGSLPPGKPRLVHAWVEIHREELVADCALASHGETIFRIEPLR
ncbi:MAG: hypothetical protein RL199_587 [Pseudomonadota bacterium]|jgi:hypothetical protein